jgi:hypothetical protein
MAEAQRDAVDRLGERLESLAAIGFWSGAATEWQAPRLNHQKSLQVQAIDGSAKRESKAVLHANPWRPIPTKGTFEA